MAARFTWFEKFSATLERIPEDMRGSFALAIIDYGVNLTEPGFEFPYDAIFESIREDIDNSRKARTENKGGRPKGSGKKPDGNGTEVFSTPENHSDETEKPPFYDSETPVSETGNPNHTKPYQTKPNKGESSAARKRFAPPSVADVRSYAEEKGIAIDADAFCDFYASKGWKVGKEPMKDWKAAARNWARRDRSDGKGGSDAKSRYAGLAL